MQMYMSVCWLCVHVRAGVHEFQKKVSIPLALELQMLIRFTMWVQILTQVLYKDKKILNPLIAESFLQVEKCLMMNFILRTPRGNKHHF